MDETLSRIRLITEELYLVRDELNKRAASQSAELSSALFDSDASNELVAFKAAVDELRQFLWHYLNEFRAASRRKLSETEMRGVSNAARSPTLVGPISDPSLSDQARSFGSSGAGRNAFGGKSSRSALDDEVRFREFRTCARILPGEQQREEGGEQQGDEGAKRSPGTHGQAL